MLKCPECGANFPQTSFVCQYCGYVNTERVSQIDKTKKLSFSEQIEVIDSNLNVLYEINHPTVSDAILKIVRIWLAIQTFGFILIFWKKSKEKFDKKRYNRLKAIVQRNIEQLKLSSKGSEQLLNKIEITENELKNIDDDIKKNIKSKKIVTLSVIFIYIALVFINASIINYKKNTNNDELYLQFNKENSYGNLTDNFDIEVKGDVNVLSGRKYVEKLDFIIGVSAKEKYVLKNTEKLDFKISLLDKHGAERVDFEAVPISEEDIAYLRLMLENEIKEQKIIKIEFIPNKKMFSLPKDLKEFSINAHILNKDDKD